MSSKARRKAKIERSRPSTFFIVAILLALAMLVAAFVGFVSSTLEKRPASTTTSLAGNVS